MQTLIVKNWIRNEINLWKEIFPKVANSKGQILILPILVLSHLLITGASINGVFIYAFIKKYLWGLIISGAFFTKMRIMSLNLKGPSLYPPRTLLMFSFFEIILVILLSPHSLGILAFIFCLQFIIYNHFFIGENIKEHLTTYSLLTSLIIVPYSIFLLSLLGHVPYAEIPFEQKIFALSHWPLLNIFIVGPKSFQKDEGQHAINYTRRMGKVGLVFFLLGQIVFNFLCLYQFSLLIRPFFINFASFLFMMYLLIIILFSIVEKEWTGKALRFFSAFFFLAIQTGVILSHFL